MSSSELSERHLTKLQRLLATAHEPALVLMDADAVITGWMMGAERVFGYTAEEAIGQPSVILYTPEDRELGIPQYELEVALARGYSENDRWMQREDGVRFWASGILNCVRDVDGRVMGFGKTLRNRTDLKGKMDALENMIESLKHAEARRLLSISTLAHELRGPLAAVSYAVEATKQSSVADELGRSTLEIIEQQCRSMLRMVEDLLDVTRMQVGKARLKRAVVSLADVVTSAMQTCRGQIDARRQHLEFISPAGAICVEGDAQRLGQVFINLIQNSSKFTPSGGSIWVKVSNEGNDAVARVEDNGTGIPSDELPKIFEMFAQADLSRCSEECGLGIGLAVVKEAIELHGGTVQVRSDGPGRGCEFTVRLPLVALVPEDEVVGR